MKTQWKWNPGQGVLRRMKSLPVILLAVIVIAAVGLWFMPASRQSSRTTPPPDKELLKQLDTSFQANPRQGLILACSIAEVAPDSITMTRALLKKASCYQMLNMADSAFLCYRQLLEITAQLGNDSLQARVFNGLANYYLRKEEYPKAMFYLTRALHFAEQAGDRNVTGLIYNGLGLVSISMKKIDQALGYFRNAKQYCIESGDQSNETGITLNIANCYAELRDYRTAREYYLEIQDQLKDTAQIILGMINLAIVNRQLGELEPAFRYLNQAIGLLADYDDLSLLSTAQLELGTTWMASGRPGEARKYLEQSLANAKGTLALTNTMEALSRLSQVNEQQGRYPEALLLYKEYTALKDSVMNDETRKSIREIQLKSDVQRKELQNQLLAQKYDMQKRRSLVIGILSGAFSIIVLLTAVLIWLSNKSLKKSIRLQELQNAHLLEKSRADEMTIHLDKLRFESEMECKNRELTALSLQLVAKNKVLSDINQMADDSYHSQLMDRNSYLELRQIVKENLNTDKEWLKFKELFEKVHHNFFTSLKNQFPELTENELRLCAYIRINCPNKEIAKILNVSPPTIVTSRYRIRKKMKLDKSVVLEDFLRNL